MGQRVPIQGEAGLGYVLAVDYDMPPLMLTPNELDAMVLGAQWVASLQDRMLANAASDVLAKIASAVPDDLQLYIIEPSLGVKAPAEDQGEAIDTAPLRRAIRDGRKLRLRYRSAAGEESERTVAPVLIGFAEASTLLIAWCDLREGFRHFRIERIVEMQATDEPTGSRPGELRRRWQQWRDQQLARSLPKLG